MLIVEFILLFIMMAINIATSEEVGFSLFKFLVRFLSFFILFLLAATDELQYSIQHYFRLSLPLQQATAHGRMLRSVSLRKCSALFTGAGLPGAEKARIRSLPGFGAVKWLISEAFYMLETFTFQFVTSG